MQATEHQTEALEDQRRAPAEGDHERCVEKPSHLQQFLLSRILQRNLLLRKAQFVPKDRIAKSADLLKVTRAPCRRNPDDPAERIQIAERLGDLITAAHKVLDEGKYAVVSAGSGEAMDSKLPIQNQISSGDAEKSSTFLTSRKNPRSIYPSNFPEFI